MVAALGRADEEGAAEAVCESGAEDFGPGGGFHRSIFVEDDEIEAVAAEGRGVECAGDEDAGAVSEVDAEFGFERGFGPEAAGERFEAIPNDALGLVVVGTDVPDDAVGLEGRAEDFGEGEIGFAEAAARDEDAETGGRIEDFELVGFEGEAFEEVGIEDTGGGGMAVSGMGRVTHETGIPVTNMEWGGAGRAKKSL